MTEPLVAGAVLGGRYRLERLLAEGGMGVLWVARRVEGGAPVALKLLKGEGNDDMMRRRLLREARAICAIRHPSVVTIHEVLELDEGAPALVMDLLEGESLRESLAREHTLSLAETVRLLLPVAEAVESAHALGIVHRDLKPENVFLARGADGATEVKVLDFGIAKFTAWDGGAAKTSALTNTGSLLGTPYYMAPEQILGERDIDGRVDIWALGVILFECLTGVRPVEDENLGKVLQRILLGKNIPIGQIAPELPEAVRVLADRMVAFDRGARPRGLAEVRAALAPFAGSQLPALSPRSVPSSAVPSGDGPTLLATPSADPNAAMGPKIATDPTLAVGSQVVVSPNAGTDPTLATGPAGSRAPLGLAAPRKMRARLAGAIGGALVIALGGSWWRSWQKHGVERAPLAVVEPSNSPRCPAGTALVPGGEFMMGSEDGADDQRPMHRVSVIDLCVDRAEVTSGAYVQCMARGACRPPSASVDYGGLSEEDRALESEGCHALQTSTANLPMNCISFHDASAYCLAVGKRLPTEEEWEHAARGGDDRSYAWGSTPPGPTLLNACDAECVKYMGERGRTLVPMFQGSDGYPTLAPAGRFPAGDSKDGLHDMSGNVWEWTSSPYCPYPRHTCESKVRVFRGGSFITTLAANARTTTRLYSRPEYRYMEIGFRCVMPPAP